jgi:hypothetical protein
MEIDEKAEAARPLASGARPPAPHLARACGDTPDPNPVVIDCRSCRSAPRCFARGIHGGKKTRGVKIQVVEKYGIPLAIDVAPANRHDTKAIVSRFCVNSPMAAFGALPAGTSASAASGRPEPGP